MNPLAIGVSLGSSAYPGWFGNDRDVIAALDAWAETMGRMPAYLSLWCSWKAPGTAPRGGDFPRRELLEALADRDVSPMIFWEPDLPPGEGSVHARILSAEFGRYLAEWANAAADWGEDIIVRFAHEQNGNWFKWCTGIDGQTADGYVAIWRHVFERMPDNVLPFWCPNATSSGDRRMLETFPGRDVVAYVGLDAYNWRNDALSLTVTHKGKVATLADLGLPIIIGEYGVAAMGDQVPRSVWLDSTLLGLKNNPAVVGATYFDIDMGPINGQPDWRLSSDPSIVEVMRRRLAQPAFQGRLP